MTGFGVRPGRSSCIRAPTVPIAELWQNRRYDLRLFHVWPASGPRHDINPTKGSGLCAVRAVLSAQGAAEIGDDIGRIFEADGQAEDAIACESAVAFGLGPFQTEGGGEQGCGFHPEDQAAMMAE
jgi:hypothetical protein